MKIREEILESLLADVYGILGSDITQDEQIALKRAFEISLGMQVQQIKEMREQALERANGCKNAKVEQSEKWLRAMASAYEHSAEVFTGEEE